MRKIITDKEMEQAHILEKLIRKEITPRDAGLRLGLSVKQVGRKLKRFEINGTKGLIHKNRGKPSKKKWNEEQKLCAIGLLKSEWKGFGPTFASEQLLKRHNIRLLTKLKRYLKIC